MMELYVDNFRGFSETYIPLRDVNFLVGENSTGKSSILALIALLGSPELWFYQKFSTETVNLGSFRDIVSVESLDKSYFRIGFIDPVEPDDEEWDACAFLLTFVQHDGLPVLSEADYLQGDECVSLAVHDGVATYESRVVKCELGRDGLTALFKTWLSFRPGTRRLEKEVKSFSDTRRLLPMLDMLRRRNGSSGQRKSRFPGIRLPFGNMAWIAPIRTKPRRTYDQVAVDFSPEGEHTPYLFRKLKRDPTRTDFQSFIDSFGQNSGLYKSIDVHDFGVNETDMAPFSLQVKLGDQPLSIASVGYGVSQSLPVIVEISAREKGTQFAIQQPEVHLHPRGQAALGDVFFQQCVEQEKTFFVETHSDYLIDRFRMNYMKVHERPDAQVLFFERCPNGNVVTPICIDESGRYSTDQPQAFRAFFLKEQLDLLEVG